MLTPRLILTSLLCLTAIHLQALDLAPLFQDHMVMQRGEPIFIQGTSHPNTKVSVRFAGAQSHTISAANGTWSVSFKARKAGGPYTLIAAASDKKIKLEDIYIGDVWLASGQSNMEWKLKWRVNNWEDEVNNSDVPLIRYFDVPNRYATTPQTTLVAGSWKLANPANSPDFSAVAWVFAKKAHLEKKVAIGIVDSTWGGTPAEAWTPKETLLRNKDYKAETAALYQDMTSLKTKFTEAQKQEAFKAELKKGSAILDSINITSMEEDPNWQAIRLPNKRLYTDIVWFKRAFNLTPSDLEKASAEASVTLDLGRFPKFSQVYINGKKSVEKPPGEHNIVLKLPPEHFNAGNNIIALRGFDDWSNRFKMGKFEQMYMIFGDNQISLEGGWQYNTSSEPKMPVIVKYWQKPATLYNGMIHPLIHLPFKGVIWYQGESNSGRASMYANLFKDLITSWRGKWNDADMPFIFVQLAGHRPIPKEVVQQSNWAELREAQAAALNLKNTGMAMALDVGDAADIHPRNKHTVAERLWLSAKKVAYNENLLASGPTFSKMNIKGDKVSVSFKHAGKGFLDKNKIKGFELAGNDGKYVKAHALIKGKKVIVSSPSVPTPKSIRYAWARNSDANLYNSEGLPAVPFRSGE